MIKYYFSKQFVLFLIVGSIAALINCTSRWVLSHWFGFGLSIVMAYILSMLTAFLLNLKLVFKNSARPIAKQISSFFFINISFLPLVLILSISITEIFLRLQIHYHNQTIAHAISVCVPALVTYLFYKFYTFRVA